MKRILSLFLTLLLVGSLFCVPASAVGEKLIAITYDDGPGAHTARLLDGLKSRGVHATFFMVGQSAARYPDLVQRVYQEGHQVANHSYNHSQLTSLSAQGVRNQIQNTNNVLDLACGAGTTYMVRAPYGSTNASVRQTVGAPLVFWSVDTLDWKTRNATAVKNAVVNGAKDGAIILVHDIHSTTVDGTLAAIDSLKSQGYEFVTVQELFRRRGLTPQNGVQYVNCPANGVDLGPVRPPDVSAVQEGDQLRITLTAQEGASIYYSTDGSLLNQGSLRYSGSFLATPPFTLRTVAAFNMNGSRSDTVVQEFTMPLTQAPLATLEDGVLTLKSLTPSASITYSLSGEQTQEATPYTAPVELLPGTTVTTWASANGCLTSHQVQYTYSHLENLFSDVHPKQWYYEAIDRAAAAGYMQGSSEHAFLPNTPVTRGQLVTLLFRASGAEAESVTAPPFQDVAPEQYYAPAVAWAKAEGIVSGYEDGSFRPDQPVLRQELAVIFQRYLDYCKVGYYRGSTSGYTDADTIPAWAEDAIGALSTAGLLSGDSSGAFSPGATATRAQAAQLLMRTVDYIARERLPVPLEALRER